MNGVWSCAVLEPQAIERGEQAFIENCGICHGVAGRGPALAEIKALSSAERRDRIRNHPIAGQIPQRLPAHEHVDDLDVLFVLVARRRIELDSAPGKGSRFTIILKL